MRGRPDSAPAPLKDEVVAQVAAALGRSPGQVLLRWGVQRGTR
jgi:diketogulonate reductase-like aldo/keto reductase